MILRNVSSSRANVRSILVSQFHSGRQLLSNSRHKRTSGFTPEAVIQSCEPHMELERRHRWTMAQYDRVRTDQMSMSRDGRAEPRVAMHWMTSGGSEAGRMGASSDGATEPFCGPNAIHGISQSRSHRDLKVARSPQ